MIGRRIAIGAAALALSVLALGLSVLLLATPPVTRALVERYSTAETLGLSSAAVRTTAETVRAYVAAGRGSLPAEVEGVAGFDAQAVSHLDDVRDVLAAARLATVFVALALGASAVWALARGMRRDVGVSLLLGSVLTVVGVGLAGLTALVDFGAFFTWFHGVFFEAGTWVFPSDSLLIQLFPEPFWATAAAAWGLSCLAFAGVYALIGGLLSRPRGGRG